MSNIKKIVDNLKSANESEFSGWVEPKYAPGDQFKALVPFSRKPINVHIVHMFPSIYDDWLIVYKVFGKHKRWWHEFMCRQSDMEHFIKMKDDIERIKDQKENPLKVQGTGIAGTDMDLGPYKNWNV